MSVYGESSLRKIRRAVLGGGVLDSINQFTWLHKFAEKFNALERQNDNLLNCVLETKPLDVEGVRVEQFLGIYLTWEAALKFCGFAILPGWIV